MAHQSGWCHCAGSLALHNCRCLSAVSAEGRLGSGGSNPCHRRARRSADLACSFQPQGRLACLSNHGHGLVGRKGSTVGAVYRFVPATAVIRVSATMSFPPPVFESMGARDMEAAFKPAFNRVLDVGFCSLVWKPGCSFTPKLLLTLCCSFFP